MYCCCCCCVLCCCWQALTVSSSIQWLSARTFAVCRRLASTSLCLRESGAGKCSPSVVRRVPISTRRCSVRTSPGVRIITAKALVARRRPSSSWIASTPVRVSSSSSSSFTSPLFPFKSQQVLYFFNWACVWYWSPSSIFVTPCEIELRISV